MYHSAKRAIAVFHRVCMCHKQAGVVVILCVQECSVEDFSGVSRSSPKRFRFRDTDYGALSRLRLARNHYQSSIFDVLAFGFGANVSMDRAEPSAPLHDVRRHVVFFVSYDTYPQPPEVRTTSRLADRVRSAPAPLVPRLSDQVCVCIPIACFGLEGGRSLGGTGAVASLHSAGSPR